MNFHVPYATETSSILYSNGLHVLPSVNAISRLTNDDGENVIGLVTRAKMGMSGGISR